MYQADLRHAALCLLLCGSPVIAPAAEPGGAEAATDFRLRLEKALESFNRRDFPQAAAQCDTLDKMQPQNAVVLNIRGAIALEERRLDEGAAFCQRALDVDPKFFPARFNMAEIPFLQKRYSAARDIYEQLQAENPLNELLQYRIFLTYLMERNDGAAEQALKKVRYPGDTGAYYYANAAWEFQHGHGAEAESWINSADRVFSRTKNAYFADALYDLGWLKRTEAKEPMVEFKLEK